MKTSIKIAVAALVIASFGIEGCKKGPNDPAISVYSRKARMTGEWKYKSGEGKRSALNSNTTWTYDGAVLTEVTTTTSPSSTTTTLTSRTISLTYEKDGTYTMVTTTTTPSPLPSTNTETETGTWNFTGGVGSQNNNKDHVVMRTLSVITVFVAGPLSTTSTEQYSGDDCPTTTMFLDELRNDKIVFTHEGTTLNGTTTETNEGSWTLEQ
jgi:hypothetical protein